MSHQTPLSRYPEGGAWLIKLLNNSQAPLALQEQVAALRHAVMAYLGAPEPSVVAVENPRIDPSTASHLLSYLMESGGANQSTGDCPTCGQKTRVDITDVKCPICASSMRVRRNRTTRQEFFGCSRYPQCRGATNLGSIILQSAEKRRMARQDKDCEIRKIEI